MTKTRAQQLAELLLDTTHHERAEAVLAWADHHATSHDHMMMLVNVAIDNLARRHREGYVDDRNRYACELAERMRVAHHGHWSEPTK